MKTSKNCKCNCTAKIAIEKDSETQESCPLNLQKCQMLFCRNGGLEFQLENRCQAGHTLVIQAHFKVDFFTKVK